MAKNNSVNNTLEAVTATTIAFSPTTGGVIGTTTNDNTTAGNVGEYITSNVSYGSPVALSPGTATDLTSINITAGDWDVWGNVGFRSAGTTTNVDGWINTTSATLPDLSFVNTSYSVGLDEAFNVPSQRISVSGNTTLYLSVFANFTVGCNARGNIVARRRR